MKRTLIPLLLALAASPAAAQDKLTISVYSFAQDAYKEALYDPFEAICDCELVIETGNSVERMAKIEANAADPVIDMAVMSSDDALALARKDLLEKLDVSKLSSSMIYMKPPGIRSVTTWQSATRFTQVRSSIAQTLLTSKAGETHSSQM